MKIQIPTTFRQFQSVPVLCSDRKMQDMLAHDRLHFENLHTLRSSGYSGEIFMFSSGAKLIMSSEKNHYSIYGYHYAGLDIKDAVAELMVLELDYHKRRIARKYYSRPQQLIATF